MKKFMKLIPALAMLLIATVLVSTATFAWFSMNTTVTATNMQVRAVAEKGLLINEVATAADTNWDELATAKQAGTDTPLAALSLLYPSSTTDGSTWYHASSKKSNSAADATANTPSANLIGTYETLPQLTAITNQSVATATAGSQAAFSTMGKTANDAAGYYVHYVYYLKGATGTQVSLARAQAGDMNVKITGVTATATADANNTTPANSADLNKALRVGIKLNSEFYIYAPVAGFDDSYFVNAGATATTPKAGNVVTLTDLQTLPAAGSDGTQVDVYIWYEGEDVNLKSDNALAATLDSMTVTITFALQEVTAAELGNP